MWRVFYIRQIQYKKTDSTIRKGEKIKYSSGDIQYKGCREIWLVKSNPSIVFGEWSRGSIKPNFTTQNKILVSKCCSNIQKRGGVQANTGIDRRMIMKILHIQLRYRKIKYLIYMRITPSQNRITLACKQTTVTTTKYIRKNSATYFRSIIRKELLPSIIETIRDMHSHIQGNKRYYDRITWFGG